MIRDDNGIAKCGIEHCWKQGEISFRKPSVLSFVSVRVRKDPFTGMEMSLYDRWDICQDACALGAAQQDSGVLVCKGGRHRVYGDRPFTQNLMP
ncbi:MAG: DUF3109 family protein [Lewinellaceae bacterium]|nr:DUF3109 family protein [Lewinellaceae bacterium]